MPRTIVTQDRTIQVPDDASDEDIRGILSQGAAPQPAAAPKPAGANSIDPHFLAPMPAFASGAEASAYRTDRRFFAAPMSPVSLGGTTDPNNAGQDSIATRLGLSLGYAAQQDPDQYARLLHLQDLTGIPPIVSAGRETQIQQFLDANRVDPEAFTINSPRTADFFSDPVSAAVAGMPEIQRQAAIERNAAAMRTSRPLDLLIQNEQQAPTRLPTDGFSAYTPTFAEKAAFNMRQATKFVTGKTTDDLVQSLYENPLTRVAIATVGGTVGQVGDIGSMAGWHGNGPSKENLFQRIETDLKPETMFAYDPIRRYAYYAQSNGLDVAAPIIAGFATGLGEEKLAALGLTKLRLSENAIKVASKLAVAITFSAASGGHTYTQTAGAGGSDDDARSAANQTFLINLPANVFAGFADRIPGLNRTPLLTSALAGGLMGGSAQVANNLVTGNPWDTDFLLQAGKGAAMQAGLHFGLGALPGEAQRTATTSAIPQEFAGEFAASSFLSNAGEAVGSSQASEFKKLAPERFYGSNQANFYGVPELRISQEPSSSQSIAQGTVPAEVAQAPSSASSVETAQPRREIKVSMPDLLSAEDGQQTAVLPDVIDPLMDLSARELRDGRVELQQWLADGGSEKLQTALEQTDPETAASPEWRAMKEELRQRYIDEGHTLEDADTLATRRANVYSNLAFLSGTTPSKMPDVYSEFRNGDISGKVGAAEVGNSEANVENAAGTQNPDDGTQLVPHAAGTETPQPVSPESQAATDKVREMVQAEKQSGNPQGSVRFASATPWLTEAAGRRNLNIDGAEHILDAQIVRHMRRGHGELTDADFDSIPAVVAEPDRVAFGINNDQGTVDSIGYVKRVSDGVIVYVEKVMPGNKALGAKTMWKFGPDTDVEGALNSFENYSMNHGGVKPVVVNGPSAGEDFAPAPVTAAQVLKNQSGDFVRSSEAVKQEIYDRLKHPSVPANKTRINAQAVHDFVVTHSAEQGITPEEFVRKYEGSLFAQAPRKFDPSEFYDDVLAKKLENDPVGAAREYNTLEQTQGGSVLSVNAARELSEFYRADKSRAGAVQTAAGDFIQELYQGRLGKPVAEGRDPVVLFTAGGSGAGKSSFLETAQGGTLSSKADIVYDDTLGNKKKAIANVQLALDSGRNVDIQYIYRDPVEAFRDGLRKAMERGPSEGRTVPLDLHLKTHLDARNTVEALREKYAGDPRVKFSAIDNTQGEGDTHAVDFDAVPPIKEDELRERLQGVLDEELRAGRISRVVADRSRDRTRAR